MIAGSRRAAALLPGDRAALAELAPVLRRLAELNPAGLARFRLTGDRATVLARLPFGVLVSRAVELPGGPDASEQPGTAVDVTVDAGSTLAWLDGERDAPPPARDAQWRGDVPPLAGWSRLDTVPDGVVRPLVRQGALALKDAAAREGVPGAQPRAEVADALLDATVLTVSDDAGRSAAVPLRSLSALTRMGFLARGGVAHIDTVGRWVRVVGTYGTVYLERPGASLKLV